MNKRIDDIRAGLNGQNNCDAFFSVSGADNQYLTNFTTCFSEISSAIVITKTEAHFMCDFRYTEQAQDESIGFTIEEISGDLLVRAGEHLKKIDCKRVAFDSGRITVDELTRVTSIFEGTMVPDKDLCTQLREVKSNDEIEIMREGFQLAEGVLRDLLPTLHEGMLERDFAAQLEYEFKKRGAKGNAFDPIILFGTKSSLPHGVPTDKALEVGDAILLDFGCRVGGYCTDMTRTFAFGESPGDWFDEIYAVTLKAHMAALEAIAPGKRCKDMDAIARDIITDAGFGKEFGHSLGHGVGIEIHEYPNLNKRSERLLEPGMVVTIEPGIYMPGKGGVRIEDTVVVTENGYDNLCTMPKELTILGQ